MTTLREELFRDANDEEEVNVTYIELFFDLVFVFAITQLSHHLLEHLSIHGAIEALILFGALWWVWIYTSWVTNWMDPDRAGVRLMLIAMMLGGLALAGSLPKAFAENGMVFASVYVAMQIGRTLFMLLASIGVNAARTRNFARIALYFVFAAPFWFYGATVEGDLRLVLWAVALAIEYVGPFLRFRTPVLGRSSIEDWDISGTHMAERCALFIIIALGEGVLITGRAYSELDFGLATTAAFVISFLATAAMWWIYFDIGAKRGAEMIEAAPDTGRIARNAYTYLHMIIVAGVVVTAVGDAMMLEHPDNPATPIFLLVTFGGPWLFLLGNFAFKWSSSGQRIGPLSHGIGMTLLIGLGLISGGFHFSALLSGGLALAALVVTAMWEWFSLHGGWQRWTPWAGKLFGRPQEG